jgi:hypothetical protein
MTKVLNIDDLLAQPNAKVVVNGVEHEMKTASVADFLQNMKDLEAMAAAPSIVAETELTVRMIARAFPTLTEDDVLKWPVPAIEKLFTFIRGIDPDAKVEAKDDEGNGSSAS